jgi:hypothetical protein
MIIYFPTCSQAIFLILPDNFIKEEAFSENDTENMKKIVIFFTKYKQGDFFICTVFNTASSAGPSDSTVSEDAEIEPRTVAISVLAVRRSNHSATSHPPQNIIIFIMAGPSKPDILPTRVYI